jgi:hypothetical protein
MSKAFRCDRCKIFQELSYAAGPVTISVDNKEWDMCKHCVAEFNQWTEAGVATRKLKESTA